MWALTAKSVAIFFGLATAAFCVSTIILAVEKSNLDDELKDALHKLDVISTTSATSFPPIIQSTDAPTFPTVPTSPSNPAEILYRLPNDIIPVKYDLYIHPDLKSKTCEGSVSIQIEINIEKTNLIVLHAKNLEINSITILNMALRIRIRIRKFYLDAEREMLFIELEEMLLQAKPYVVSIVYSCQMTGLSGIYASSYLDTDDTTRFYRVYKSVIHHPYIFKFPLTCV